MATQKQKALIKAIENELYVTFSGETVKEASAFITTHLPEFREQRQMMSQAMEDAMCIGDH